MKGKGYLFDLDGRMYKGREGVKEGVDLVNGVEGEGIG